MSRQVPVIDLFAGPGGLGEGFSSFKEDSGAAVFRVSLSIECDLYAHETLLLRSFFRQFSSRSRPEDYYRYLRKELNRETLFSNYTKQYERAKKEAWLARLGNEPREHVTARISQTIGDNQTWVLIGGPPCQAYSPIGRARMLSSGRSAFEKDDRHYLYREYLQILADHKPPVFVMENVKGILSATVKGKKIFDQMLGDLRRPSRSCNVTNRSVTYEIYSLVKRSRGLVEDQFDPSDFVIRSERYGIPQTRHRVILLGVRRDLNVRPDVLRRVEKAVFLADVIKGLPRVRSGLSRMEDTCDKWLSLLKSFGEQAWVQELVKTDGDLWSEILSTINRVRKPCRKTGGEFLQAEVDTGRYRSWFLDRRLGGVCNHTTRKHMQEDLFRYLFVSVFTKTRGRSPNLKDFPKTLLPAHENVDKGVKNDVFGDRFRAQMWDRPSCTITSHMSKDGHYYIHPDPTQCRSLTVREAARLQTFPDNYFFEGSRTQQYRQVGNAVPPLLARKIARVVHRVLKDAGLL